MKFLKKIIKAILKKNTKAEYKIGNIKKHNSHIDTLLPEFIEIGNNFISAPGSVILAHDASLFIQKGVYRIQKTIIGDDVFIGANAVILPGVVLGNRCIVGAGAVVTKSFPSESVIVGNPAKKISTVEEYYNKCIQRETLIKAPLSFQKVKKGIPLTKLDIELFRSEASKKLENGN